jgi:hypothetical protein
VSLQYGMIDEESKDTMINSIDGFLETLWYYQGLAQFMKIGKNAHAPEIKTKARDLDNHFKTMSDKFHALMEEMETENKAIWESLYDTRAEITKQEQWWESTNMFHPGKQRQEATISVLG